MAKVVNYNVLFFSEEAVEKFVADMNKLAVEGDVSYKMRRSEDAELNYYLQTTVTNRTDQKVLWLVGRYASCFI